jgi:hypothetical protein
MHIFARSRFALPRAGAGRSRDNQRLAIRALWTEEVTYKFGAARRELWTCLIP